MWHVQEITNRELQPISHQVDRKGNLKVDFVINDDKLQTHYTSIK